MNSGVVTVNRWKQRARLRSGLNRTPRVRHSAIVLAILVFIMVPWQPYGRMAATGPAESAPLPDLRILTSSADSIVLELHVPDWEVSPQKIGEQQFDEIIVPGFSHTSEPGKPRFPVRLATLGIPPGVKPQMHILEVDGPQIKAGYQPAANPSPALHFDAGTPLSLTALSGPPKPQIELADGDNLYPAFRGETQDLAQIVEVGRLRSQPFVQIRLNPFQYDPQAQVLHAYSRLRVAVTFESRHSPPATVDEGPFESVLQSLLLNYAEAKAWRVPPETLSPVGIHDFYTGIRYRIEVSQAGLHLLDRTLLPESDIADYPFSTFQLFEDYNLSADSEAALEIVDWDGDDQFDTWDAIRFYGRGPAEAEQRYTGTRVYWLVAGREPGKRMATRSAPPGSGTTAPNFPTTVHVEENHNYYWDLPKLGGSDAHWYWSYLVQTDSESPLQQDYVVSTPDVSYINHNVTLRAKFMSLSSNPGVNPDHHVKLYLDNGTRSELIADTTWDGQRGIVVEAANIASSKLNQGNNTVRVEVELLPGIVADALFLDWIEVDYLRAFIAQGDRLTFTAPNGYSEYQITGFSNSAVGVYDITDAQNPVRLTNTQVTFWGWLRFRDQTPSAERYIATVLQTPALLRPDKTERLGAGDDLRAPNIGAEYLIITHADFTAAADRLAAHRATDFSVRVVQVQDIYNQFGNSILDPEAIHDFLAYAFDNWSPRPQYVLFMGDGSYDYRDYLGKPRANFIPPYMAMVDPWLGETADENYYAAVSGPDIVPDLFAGRLPVNTLDEANAVVDKIINYERDTSLQAPRALPTSALFVTDDYEPTRSAGNFPRMADAIASETIPDSYDIRRVYYRETHATVNAVRSAIVSSINQGQQFVNYVGHSSVGQWADEGFLASSDADSLDNAGKLPVVLGMTCLEGSYQDATQDAVAERLVRAVSGGAVASWSPTGLGVATGHDELNRGFYDALFKVGVGRLGPAVMQGKIRLYSTGGNLDLIHTFVLLGDPATDTGIEAPCTPPRADVTGDGRMDTTDLAELSKYWHTFHVSYDQDDNGYINIRDLQLVAAAWGSGCGQ